MCHNSTFDGCLCQQDGSIDTFPNVFIVARDSVPLWSIKNPSWIWRERGILYFILTSLSTPGWSFFITTAAISLEPQYLCHSCFTSSLHEKHVQPFFHQCTRMQELVWNVRWVQLCPQNFELLKLKAIWSFFYTVLDTDMPLKYKKQCCPLTQHCIENGHV